MNEEQLIICELANEGEQQAAERTKLMEDVKNLLNEEPHLRDVITSFDTTFIRKLYNYPGDITSFRIGKVMRKLLTM